MTKRSRKILRSVFILAFFVITPLLIMYAMGYTFGSGFKLEKTGILVLETEPEDALIFLNGQTGASFWGRILNSKQDTLRTPAKIKNLKPGEYEIRIEKEGYWPWQKRLKVVSGLTTFAEDIFLFRKDEAVRLAEFTDGLLSFSPDYRYLANLRNTSAELFDLKKDSLESIVLDNASSTEKVVSELAWSESSSYLSDAYRLFRPDDWSGYSDIAEASSSPLEDQAWSRNGKDLSFLRSDGIYLLDPKSRQSERILSMTGLSAIYPGNDYYLLVREEAGGKSLLLWKRSSKDIVNLLKLPDSVYGFRHGMGKYVELRDKNNSIAYILDLTSELRPLATRIDRCVVLRWVDEKTFLSSDGYEINIYDPEKDEKRLLTRLSERINDLQWHPSENYIAFSSEDGLRMLELDDREKHNIVRIKEAKGIKEFFIDKDKNAIYYIQEEEGKKSLYKIFIQ